MCQIQQQTFFPEKDGRFKTFHFGLYVFVKGPPPSFPPSAPAMPVQPSAPPPAGPGGSSTATTYSSSSSHSSSYSSHSSSSSVSSSSSTKVLRNVIQLYILGGVEHKGKNCLGWGWFCLLEQKLAPDNAIMVWGLGVMFFAEA